MPHASNSRPNGPNQLDRAVNRQAMGGEAPPPGAERPELDNELSARGGEIVEATLRDNANLATLLYDVMVPRVARFAGASECQARTRGSHF